MYLQDYNNLWDIFLTSGDPVTYLLYSKSEKVATKKKTKENTETKPLQTF